VKKKGHPSKCLVKTKNTSPCKKDNFITTAKEPKKVLIAGGGPAENVWGRLLQVLPCLNGSGVVSIFPEYSFTFFPFIRKSGFDTIGSEAFKMEVSKKGGVYSQFSQFRPKF